MSERLVKMACCQKFFHSEIHIYIHVLIFTWTQLQFSLQTGFIGMENVSNRD